MNSKLFGEKEAAYRFAENLAGRTDVGGATGPVMCLQFYMFETLV